MNKITYARNRKQTQIDILHSAKKLTYLTPDAPISAKECEFQESLIEKLNPFFFSFLFWSILFSTASGVLINGPTFDEVINVVHNDNSSLLLKEKMTKFDTVNVKNFIGRAYAVSRE
jgi:hypothetical protein